VAASDGALVLVENTPHRDMDADPARTTEPTPFGAHLEQLLGTATGRRLYAGFWDGWQWSPYRDQLLAGGAFRGQAISSVPVEQVTGELRRWDVRHLFVWSGASVEYFRAHPALFVERWSSGLWHDFDYVEAAAPDPPHVRRAVLEAFDPLGGRVRVDDVQRGDEVVIGTNYHPSWTAAIDGLPGTIALHERGGQLAFTAPQSGSYDVRLIYPRRPALGVLALCALLAGSIALSRWPARRST